MEKETKNFQLKVRVTNSEKEEINNYCEEHNITISDFLRVAIGKMFKEEK
jgi:antitoxin component of RelBE/YafQ-DinJ toxin-antitoxin module